jgi:hypothetical protein
MPISIFMLLLIACGPILIPLLLNAQMARLRNVNPSAQHDGNAARAKTAGVR